MKKIYIIIIIIIIAGGAYLFFISKSAIKKLTLAPEIDYIIENGVLYSVNKEGIKIEVAASTTDQIVVFSESSTDRELYLLTEKGELIKKTEGGNYLGLVTYADMSDERIEWQGTTIEYVKGKVLNFYLSPNGKYIAYIIQEGLAGCCAGPPNKPSMRIVTMNSDGSNKIMLDEVPYGRPSLSIYGWIADSRGFVYSARHLDEATQSSPFYISKPGLPEVDIFRGIDYGFDPTGAYSIMGSFAQPSFSPTDHLMVYRRGGYGNREIILSDVDGNNKKIIMYLEDENADSKITWSEEGERIFVTTNDNMYSFDKSGEVIQQNKK